MVELAARYSALPNATNEGMSRWQASGIHLGISAVIATLVVAVIYLVWYPESYFTAMGGEQLVYLLVGVDVVIGPLITLIIFKSGKKGLVFDLAMIGFMQAAALVYGVTIASAARPVYSVFVVDRFEAVSANAIDAAELARVKLPEFKSLPWTGPLIVGIEKPADSQEHNRIVFAMADGKDLQHFPQHFVPYSEVAAEAGRRAQPLEALRRFNQERAGEIDDFLRRRGVKEAEVGYLALRARRGERAVIVRRNGEVLGTLNLAPWGM